MVWKEIENNIHHWGYAYKYKFQTQTSNAPYQSQSRESINSDLEIKLEIAEDNQSDWVVEEVVFVANYKLKAPISTNNGR